ncbi:MAG: acyltransferase family protein [Flavobacteriales bacterium]
METSKTYFPGLNGLRFFAAFAVLVTHVEFTKKVMYHGDIYWLQIDKWISGNAFTSITEGGPHGPIHWLSPFVTQGGYMGVIFFFVLSGFLITYLLLEESRVKKKIAIGKFYMRRILRIWPLYFFVTLLGFFILHHIPWFEVVSQEDEFFKHFGLNLICYVFMLPNLAFAFVMEAVPNLGQLWSIGVEEQFYLMWPLLLAFSKRPMRTITLFLIGVLTLKAIFYAWIHFVAKPPALDPDLMIYSPIETAKRFVGTLKFESMALGGLGACLVFYRKESWLRWIYHTGVQILAYASIPLIVLFTPKSLYSLLYLLFSVPFLIIIMNVGCNVNSILHLRGRVFDFLGRISFGIYMYHLICIAFAFHAIDYFCDFDERLTGWESALLYICSIPLTILVSWLSHEYIEKLFIRKKRQYTTIISGDEARES